MAKLDISNIGKEGLKRREVGSPRARPCGAMRAGGGLQTEGTSPRMRWRVALSGHENKFSGLMTGEWRCRYWSKRRVERRQV